MVESVREAQPKEQKTLQKAWVSGDSTITLLPGFRTYNTSTKQLKSLFYTDSDVAAPEYERYHNKQDWICLGVLGSAAAAASACQTTEPGTDFGVWGHKPQQPAFEIIPYSMNHKVEEHGATWPLGTGLAWGQLYPLVQARAWAPFQAPTSEEFKDGACGGPDQGAADCTGTPPANNYYDTTNTGMLLNMIYYAQQVDWSYSADAALGAYNIERASVYTQWCQKRYLRGYQSHPGQRLCVYRDTVTTVQSTTSPFIIDEYVYGAGESTLLVGTNFGHVHYMSFDEGETGQMNPTYFLETTDGDSTNSNSNFQFIFTPQEPAARGTNATALTNQDKIVAMSKYLYPNSSAGYYLQAIARSFDVGMNYNIGQYTDMYNHQSGTVWGSSVTETPRSFILKNLMGFTAPLVGEFATNSRDGIDTEEQFPYQFSTDRTLDSEYDVPGVYSATTNTRTKGQASHHAYLWYEDYHYRPGTLVEDVQEIYMCKPLDEGGDKCGSIRPSSTDSAIAWEKQSYSMTTIPYSEQRMQQFYPSVTAQAASADATATNGSTQVHGGWFNTFYVYATTPIFWTDSSLDSRQVKENSELDPFYWNAIYSSRYTKLRIDVSVTPDRYINRPTANWEEYTRTNYTRSGNPAFNNNQYFEYWAFLGDQDYTKIFDDKVWACEHERAELCAAIPPGTLSSEMNGVWRETLTKSDRYEMLHRSIQWKQGQLFYPGELSNGSDGVYRCKPWPRSESCGGYTPAQTGAATYIWDFTEIDQSSTTNADIDVQYTGIYLHEYFQTYSDQTQYNAGDQKLVGSPVFADQSQVNLNHANAYKWKIPSDQANMSSGEYPIFSVAMDASYLNLNSIDTANSATTEDKELPYIMQCRDFEDHILNDQFFAIGSYACASQRQPNYNKGPPGDIDLIVRAFECISDFCSYSEPSFDLVADEHWRMSRAKPEVIPESQPIATVECSEWQINHPYMPGDYVCNENMVWACILDQPNKDNSLTAPYYAVTQDYPYDHLEFTFQQQHLALGCRNFAPSWFVLDAPVKWVPVKFWPNMKDYQEPEFKECVDYDMWSLKYHRGNVYPSAPAYSEGFHQTPYGDVLHAYETGDFACRDGMVWECTNKFGCNSELHTDNSYNSWEKIDNDGNADHWAGWRDENYWPADHRFAWKLTQFLPKMITPMEKAAQENRPDKKCNFIAAGDNSSTNYNHNVLTFFDSLGNFVEQHNQGFNADNHRYVPGDVVCVYDKVSGAFNVYECPPAPAGNWCCTVDIADTIDVANGNNNSGLNNALTSQLNYGSNTVAATATGYKGVQPIFNQCQVTHYDEFDNLVNQIEIGPYYNVDQATVLNAATTEWKIHENIPDRDPVHQNWRDITSEVLPRVSDWQLYYNDDTSSDSDAKDLAQQNKIDYGTQNNMYRQCYEWKYVNRREQTDPRYTPHDYLFGEYACQHQRVYECLQPAFCTETEPVNDDGKIWKITWFYSFYNEDEDWVTHRPNYGTDPVSSDFEKIAVTTEGGNDVFTFSEDSPDLKSTHAQKGRDCDPQYCYYWESGVAWMPDQYTCDASNQLWQCNSRQDIAAKCTITAPVYDSPDTLDEELVWKRVEKPVLPAAAPEQIVKDCHVLDASSSNYRYFFQVGDLACEKSDSATNTKRVWMCIHEKRCNDIGSTTPQLPWTDDYLGYKAFVPDSFNPDDNDTLEPAWKLTHYIANPITPKPVTGCVAATTWSYEYHYLMDDCVKTTTQYTDVHAAATDILWKCKRPEICALINPETSLFGALTDDTTDADFASLHRRYGIGVWEPVTAWDNTGSTAGSEVALTYATSCLRGDSFPFNDPIKTGDKVCIQPTAYGPYRYDNIFHAVKADDTTKDRAGYYEQFNWQGDQAASSRSDNSGFRRVWECVGGDLCNQIYPLEDLYRHEMNLETGMLDFVGHDMSYRTIPTYEMSEAELILIGDKSQTVWKLTRERFPQFATERTAWEDLYNAVDTDNNAYVFDYTNYEDLTSNTMTNEVTQMTQPVFSLEAVAAGNNLDDDTRIFWDFPNWFPKYERNVYDWDSSHLYMHGDFVVSPQSTWSDINGDHKEADKIVWMCILPQLCSKQSPGAYYSDGQKSYYPTYETLEAATYETYKYLKDFVDEEGDNVKNNRAINFDNAVSVQFLRPSNEATAGNHAPETQYRQIFIDEVWERRDHETAAATRLTSATLNNVDKKAYVWTGPYGEHEENINGYLMNYRFQKGDHVCFTPDSVAGIGQRVYECTHETDCVEYKPYDLRVGEYFLDRFDQVDLTTGNGQFFHAKNAMWSKNWPNLNRGNPWKLTTYRCDQDILTFPATVHNSNARYLPGDYVVTTSTNPSVVYVCRQNCNDMTSSDVADQGGDPATISSLTTDGTGIQNRWKKVYGSYDIEIIDEPEWPEVDCTPITHEYLPSPNFYPPDEQAGTPGGYGCLNGNVFECMHPSCNDPSRHFSDSNSEWFEGYYLNEFKAEDANDYIKDWIKGAFVYDPSVDQYDTANSNPEILIGGVRRFITVEDTNQLLWRQIRAVAPITTPTPTEQCSPWKAGRVYVTFDLVCTRTQVYTCVNKRGCGLFDPRFDDANDYWMERTSTPDLVNVATQPTIDCIDFDSKRSAFDIPDGGNSYISADQDYYGVEQEEAWFSEFREDDPINSAQMQIRLDEPDSANTEFLTIEDFYKYRQSSVIIPSTLISEANDDFITATDSVTNKFVDQIAVLQDWGGYGTITEADYPARIERKPKFLYIKHGDYVCYDGFVYQYRQDIVNSFDWTYVTDSSGNNQVQYERQRGIYHTRNGWGAFGDGFTTPSEYGATWEIQRAIPNPLVEERRVLPEVNCTYWEPYRPYLRGDIVCRFAPDNMGGLESRDYTITAYMCRVENVMPTNLETQFNNDLQNEGFQKIASSGTDRFSQYSNHRADLCTGAVWETIYVSPQYEDSATLYNVVATDYSDREKSGNYNDHQESQVVVQGVSNYWIPINATPVLQTERQYTHYQSCVHPLLFASEDESYEARRMLADTDFSDYYFDDQALHRRYWFLPTNMWEYISYTDDTTRADLQPVAGTATTTDTGFAIPQKCYKASSDVYLMEQKSYTVVPNWDFSCSALPGMNYRIKYDISNPTEFPRQIQPFRNTFNGDDTLQLCAYGRVYACTSNRPCTIAFGKSSDPASATFASTSYEQGSTATYKGYGTAAINPWLDSTNLDLLGNTGDLGSQHAANNDAVAIFEQNNYDPSFVLTRYAPFYPREFKQLDNAPLGGTGTIGDPTDLVNHLDDNSCDTTGTAGAAVCDGSDDAADFLKYAEPTPPLLSRGASFIPASEYDDPVLEYLPARDASPLEAFIYFYVDNKLVGTHVTDHSANGQDAATVAASATSALQTAIGSTEVIETVRTGFLGGKDVLVRAVNVADCINNQANTYVCYSRPSDPMWFRTRPYFVATIDQVTMEKGDRINYLMPPYKTTDTSQDGSSVEVTVYWEKHPGPNVVRYDLYYWEFIHVDGILSGTCTPSTTLWSSTGYTDLSSSTASGTAPVATSGGGNTVAVAGHGARQTASQSTASILALDQPYLTITGLTNNYYLAYVVKPVIYDVDGSTELLPDDHTTFNDGTSGLDTLSVDVATNRWGMYRPQPVSSTFNSFDLATASTTGTVNQASLTVVLSPSADSNSCYVDEYVGIIVEESVNQRPRNAGSTANHAFDTEPNLYESAFSMGNPEYFPEAMWQDTTLSATERSTLTAPTIIFDHNDFSNAIADASGFVLRTYVKHHNIVTDNDPVDVSRDSTGAAGSLAIPTAALRSKAVYTTEWKRFTAVNR